MKKWFGWDWNVHVLTYYWKSSFELTPKVARPPAWVKHTGKAQNQQVAKSWRDADKQLFGSAKVSRVQYCHLSISNGSLSTCCNQKGFIFWIFACSIFTYRNLRQNMQKFAPWKHFSCFYTVHPENNCALHHLNYISTRSVTAMYMYILWEGMFL